jgi:transposase
LSREAPAGTETTDTDAYASLPDGSVLIGLTVVQLRNPTEGRTYFDAKKAADQKRREATGPGGHSGTTLQSSVTDLTPDIGSSVKPLPGPATPQPKCLVIAGP